MKKEKCVRGTGVLCGCQQCQKPSTPPIDPIRKFRWILRIPGVPEWTVRSARSLPGRMLEVGLFWPEGQALPAVPELAPKGPVHVPRPRTSAALCLLGPGGEISQTYDITFQGYELLLFDLDYGSSEPTEPRLVLTEVDVRVRAI